MTATINVICTTKTPENNSKATPKPDETGDFISSLNTETTSQHQQRTNKNVHCLTQIQTHD